MRTHLIAYDLLKPETAAGYASLIDAIKALGDWRKPLESTWFVRIGLSASDVRGRLRSRLDSNNKLMVLDVTGLSAWAPHEFRRSSPTGCSNTSSGWPSFTALS